MPSDSAPTFEDVVLYANKQNLIGRVDIRKFYDYYSRSHFLYRGALMDWQGKLREWDEYWTHVSEWERSKYLVIY